MAWAEIANVKAGSANTVSVVTGAIDTTGADFLIAVVGSYGTANPPQTADFTDSKGNTWSMLTPRGTNNSICTIFYSSPASVGSGHTFTFARGAVATYPSSCVFALSGSNASPFDQQNGAEATATTLATGSITPTQDVELIIAGVCTSQVTTPTIDQGLTVRDHNIFTSGTYMGSTLAWKAQTTAAAINATWSTSTADIKAAVIASFKAGASGLSFSSVIVRQAVKQASYH